MARSTDRSGGGPWRTRSGLIVPRTEAIERARAIGRTVPTSQSFAGATARLIQSRDVDLPGVWADLRLAAHAALLPGRAAGRPLRAQSAGGAVGVRRAAGRG